MTAVVGRALRWASLRKPSGFKVQSKVRPFRAFVFCSFAGLFCILRKFLLHCFGAFELLQKIVVAPRDGFLHRFFIGTTQLLSDCPSNGLERNNRIVWHLSHLDQCLESNIVSRENPCSKNICCVATGDSGCEAYTAIAWGVGLSHERSDIAGAESLYSLEGNMCGTVLRGAVDGKRTPMVRRPTRRLNALFRSLPLILTNAGIRLR
jgi:hypothetical protein